MERRENALREALNTNVAESDRWENYKKENEIAVDNLEAFGKRLTLDVMVPIGRKALIPGQLIHTNEVLVGHYQGYFSKCSAHKAKEICEYRIVKAREHLQQLQTEAELWQNKLEKPYLEGVLPNAEERDIIEDYDEEREKLWRNQHRLSMKKNKLREKEERQAPNTPSPNNIDSGIFEMLDEAELMEELEKELSQLEVDELNDDTLRKLMSGEMELPQKKVPRIAHNLVDSNSNNSDKQEDKLSGVVKKTDINADTNKIPPTNNNIQPNPELLLTTAGNGNDSDDIEESELPEEVRIIKAQAKFLHEEDQIGFYEYQIQITKQKLLTIPHSDPEGINEKIKMLIVLENLQELLELAEEALGVDELTAQDTENESEEKENADGTSQLQNGTVSSQQNGTIAVQQKRRISFALEDQTLEFRKNETVADMLPSKIEQPIEPPKRDVIRLDGNYVMTTEPLKPVSVTPVDKKQTILDKVEKNLQYVAEHQSKLDFDLVNKILDNSMHRANTLHVHFKHSSQSNDYVGSSAEAKEEDVPGTPADFYNLYMKSLNSEISKEEPATLFVNGYEGEDQLKIPLLRETERQQAYVDPRMEFSKPGAFCVDENVTQIEDGNTNSTKSILRNKSAVANEKHILSNSNQNNINKKKKKKVVPTKVDEGEYMSAYYKVMNDVIEKPITEPEPLPEGKFIDANAPKKRVSRFKQMRSTAGT